MAHVVPLLFLAVARVQNVTDIVTRNNADTLLAALLVKGASVAEGEVAVTDRVIDWPPDTVCH